MSVKADALKLMHFSLISSSVSWKCYRLFTYSFVKCSPCLYSGKFTNMLQTQPWKKFNTFILKYFGAGAVDCMRSWRFCVLSQNRGSLLVHLQLCQIGGKKISNHTTYERNQNSDERISQSLLLSPKSKISRAFFSYSSCLNYVNDKSAIV